MQLAPLFQFRFLLITMTRYFIYSGFGGIDELGKRDVNTEHVKNVGNKNRKMKYFTSENSIISRVAAGMQAQNSFLSCWPVFGSETIFWRYSFPNISGSDVSKQLIILFLRHWFSEKNRENGYVFGGVRSYNQIRGCV